MKRNIQFMVVFLFVLILSACATIKPLDSAKKDYNNKRYAKVANIKISCKDSDEGCNQLYLLKGNACYLLAKEGTNPQQNFDCAITQLDKGIQITKQWKFDKFDLNKAQTYENLCESLREKQDMNKGEVAKKITERLLKTSEAFKTAVPDNLAAIFFYNDAKFTLLNELIFNAPDNPKVCAAVNKILSELNQVSDSVAKSRYAKNFTNLINSVKGVKPALTNCQ